MNQKNDFIKSGFQILETENNDNKLLNFLKENYPTTISDNELKLDELKTILNLPIDEKVNGYGLNFIGRNVARAKYAQPTDKELKVNEMLSKNFDTTKNLVLKGDNLDSLKSLKNHYNEKIKCIYIDPPYNTANDNFVYPDKFNKEEAEVLGLANISESDCERMEFSFRTKKSHNGWLSFMYPRLLLARDLLSKDGVIFISIDDNEQANLKLLCDEVFGEENFVGQIANVNNPKGRSDDKFLATAHEYMLVYAKNVLNLTWYGFEPTEEIIKRYNKIDEEGGKYREIDLRKTGENDLREDRPNLFYFFHYNEKTGDFYPTIEQKVKEDYICIFPQREDLKEGNWRWGIETAKQNIFFLLPKFMPNRKVWGVMEKDYLAKRDFVKPTSSWTFKDVNSERGSEEMVNLNIDKRVFPKPKPLGTIKRIVQLASNKSDIILDFFAGSGTTGHAVMQLNAEDGGNRKFILCQIDEPISEDKPAYQFCVENNLPPVISSITIERLKRAGAKIEKQIEEENSKNELFDKDKKQVPDIGFKSFDSIDAPKLVLENEQISISFEQKDDSLSRIYNMIFSVGIDEPTENIECVSENCIYRIGNHYYIINSEKIEKDELSNILKNGEVFIDGWSANINTTLQNYKEDVKIVF